MLLYNYLIWMIIPMGAFLTTCNSLTFPNPLIILAENTLGNTRATESNRCIHFCLRRSSN